MRATIQGSLPSFKHIVGMVIACLLLLTTTGVRSAVAATPWWYVTSNAAPTNLPPGGEGEIIVAATNIGDASMSSKPITITDSLPAGLTVQSISFLAPQFSGANLGEFLCTTTPVSCTFPGLLGVLSPAPLRPYERIEMKIAVKVEGAESDGDNEVNISGGGAPSAVVRRPVIVDDAPTLFGIDDYMLALENEGGSPDTQAGSHPFQLTNIIALNRTTEDFLGPPGLPRDLRFNLPAGLVGNPTPLPQCTDLEFTTLVEDLGTTVNLCSANTAVGVAIVSFATNNGEPTNHGEFTDRVPIFNLVPLVGEPARFGFAVAGVPVTLDTSVRAGRDYGVVVSVDNISESVSFVATQATFWGVPGDSRHDQSRGWECLRGGPSCVPLGLAKPAPFLTLPTSCTGPLQSAVEADSWRQAGGFQSFPASEPLQALDGCNHLGFEPSISVAPDGPAASTPAGLTVGVHVPQEINLNQTGLAEADVKDTTVALPAGVQLSPSAADGLQACSNAQIGFTGINQQSGTDEFTPDAPACPNPSKLATVKIKTPLLPNPLEGAVYLAAPQNFAGTPLENPFSSLVAMYLVAEDPVSGVLVKLPGKVTPDPVTGQLVATFENTPQLPFEDLELHFFGGDRAPLSTPASCGTYTTQALFTPWSGNQPVTPSSSFEITSGPNGAPCSDPQPFEPGFQAGSLNLQAGAFTPFTVTMTRPDADQTLGGVEMQMPPGLSGALSNVKLCGEPQAAQGTCGEESLIGHAVVSAGLGSDPYTVTGGKVYITTGYKGAPFGLSIVDPAAAGPFILDEGRPVVVRASIYVDPHTAALRIVSDPLPTILDGIPLQLQHVNIAVDRENFTFNPTDCNKMAIDGTLSSSEGARAAVSTPFQVTNCAALAFKPKFAASVSAKTSKEKGASLSVKLTYPSTPQGSEANIAKVKVDLPKQLPSRLTTLQKACTAKVFEANPANCPSASIVGHAKAITPIIPVPLVGPAYFVSHGGEAFPSLVVVLQGAAPYGVTVDLVGTTFISKAGITSSTFKAVPDVPVGSFELALPEGKFSALAANLPAKFKGDFCAQKLAMPTAFVAQNGAEIHESTKIGVSGCPKAKQAKHPKKAKSKKKQQRKK
jgi:uncharacterized repeat protein (TIGR01451 family)